MCFILSMFLIENVALELLNWLKRNKTWAWPESRSPMQSSNTYLHKLVTQTPKKGPVKEGNNFIWQIN